MNFAAILPDLKARLAGTSERIAKLQQERRLYALDAASGDAEAKKAITEIDADAGTARSETEMLALAIEEAEKREANCAAQVAAEDRRLLEHEARATCAAILEADREFDRAAERLCQSLSRREELVRKLANLGVVYPGVVHALRRRQNINAALAHTGVHRFADLHLAPPSLRKPLAELDASLSNPMMSRAAAGADSPRPAGWADCASFKGVRL